MASASSQTISSTLRKTFKMKKPQSKLSLKTRAKFAVLLHQEGHASFHKDYDEDKEDYAFEPHLTVRFDISPTENEVDPHHRGYLQEISVLTDQLENLDKARAEVQVKLDRTLLATACWHGTKF